MTFDTIIVGGGACGLLAARELCRAGHTVVVIEARNYPGGRMNGSGDMDFSNDLQEGAEFVHGDVLITQALIREYGLELLPVTGKIWHCEENRLHSDNKVIVHQDILERELQMLREDIPVHDFLQCFIPGKTYEPLRNEVTRFVEGYDTADTERASTFAFREEWLGYEEDRQYRIKGGYRALSTALAADVEAAGCTILTGETVRTLRWEKNAAEVITSSYKIITSKRIIITCPVGVLRATGGKSHISISPYPHRHMEAVKKLGFGGVIKFNLQFTSAFWSTASDLRPAVKNASFIFTDATVPTWWFPYGSEVSHLTGWLGGPAAFDFKLNTAEELRDLALESLAYIMREDFSQLKGMLTAWKVTNWCTDPYSLGSYRYNIVGEKALLDVLREPVEDTLYFAGETVYHGSHTGTVEAAFASALEVVEKIKAVMAS